MTRYDHRLIKADLRVLTKYLSDLDTRLAAVENAAIDLSMYLKMDGSRNATGQFTFEKLVTFLKDFKAQGATFDDDVTVKDGKKVDGVDISEELVNVDGSTPITGAQTINGLLTLLAGLAVTGNITVSGTVDGVDVSAKDAANETDHTTYDAYAASIAAKLPLAGGTMSGNIAFSGAQTVDGRDVSALGTTLDNLANALLADLLGAGYQIVCGTFSFSATTVLRGYTDSAGGTSQYLYHYGTGTAATGLTTVYYAVACPTTAHTSVQITQIAATLGFTGHWFLDNTGGTIQGYWFAIGK